jgi:hypothetical protein
MTAAESASASAGKGKRGGNNSGGGGGRGGGGGKRGGDTRTDSGMRRRRPRGKKKTRGGPGGGSRDDNKTGRPSTKRGSGSSLVVQTKIIIRNIQDTNRFGMIKKIVESLIEPMIDVCMKDKANNLFDIDLDRSTFQQLIRNEELVEERRAKEQAEMEEAQKAKNENDDGDDGQNQTENPSDVGQPSSDSTKQVGDDDDDNKEQIAGSTSTAADQQSTNTADKLEIVVAPKVPSSLPTATIRALHVVPPRMTHRRGERAGVAYLLVVAPPPKLDSDDSSKASSSAPTTGPSKISKSKTDNARNIAKGRLLVSEVISCLQELAIEDAKTEQKYGGCTVENCLNARPLKLPLLGQCQQKMSKRAKQDRREGTVESTEHFQKWLESLAQQKEELNARPKPTPGGGALLSTAPGNNVDGGQPVAALVQHLLAKKDEKKRAKKFKKMDDEKDKKKSKKDLAKGKGKDKRKDSSANKKASTAEKKSRRSRRREKSEHNDNEKAAAAKKAKTKKPRSRRKPTGSASGGAVPTALLKPKPNNKPATSNT